MNALGRHVTVAMISMNEEKSVAKVINNIQRVMPEAEIVLVDSSEDHTPDIALALGAKVIRQYPPRGYGVAMMAALQGGSRDIVVTMDCDDTYPVKNLPEMASLILEQGYDVVDASRLKTKPHAMPWLNYLANVFFAKVASLLFSCRVTDLHSGMRAYRKRMFNELSFTADGHALPVELLLKPILHHYKVHSIDIDYHERIGESKMRPFHSVWWTIKRLINLRLNDR